MASPVNIDVKSYTTDELPDGMWIHWGRITPRDITLNRRSRRLYAADVACDQKHGKGLIEMALEHEIINEQDIQRAFELDPPENHEHGDDD